MKVFREFEGEPTSMKTSLAKSTENKLGNWALRFLSKVPTDVLTNT